VPNVIEGKTVSVEVRVVDGGVESSTMILSHRGVNILSHIIGPCAISTAGESAKAVGMISEDFFHDVFEFLFKNFKLDFFVLLYRIVM
tara:strand:+ start:22116 stop:22379 length:264 start_codon:yes stop_codon:yes gene_type:complete